MTNETIRWQGANHGRDLTAEEYADQLIEAYRIFDDAGITDRKRAAFVAGEVRRYLCRPEGINGAPPLDPGYINTEYVASMVRERLAAAAGRPLDITVRA